MAEFNRHADVVWQGNREGSGKITTGSGLINAVKYSFPSRFGQDPGTNPEELLAAAHAACFTQFMVSKLAAGGFNVQEINTQGTCTLDAPSSGNPKITKIRLVTHARIAGIDNAKFQEIVKDSEKNCPVSSALKAVPLEVEAKLVAATAAR